jgi:methylase of polypeptide subunit release factors
MYKKTSAAHDAAKRQYESAPADAKPSALQLARDNGLDRTTIHRAEWFKPTQKRGVAK